MSRETRRRATGSTPTPAVAETLFVDPFDLFGKRLEQFPVLSERRRGIGAEMPVEPIKAMEVFLICGEQVAGGVETHRVPVLGVQGEELRRSHDGVVGVGGRLAISCVAPGPESQWPALRSLASATTEATFTDCVSPSRRSFKLKSTRFSASQKV